MYARNHLILAAPVVSEAIQMVNRVHKHPVLELPHIKNLSLKNCWMSPHIFTAFVSSLGQSALETLTLDSVSLTASLALNAAPAPVTGPAHVALAPPNPPNLQNLAVQAVQAGGVVPFGQFAGQNHLQNLAVPGANNHVGHPLLHQPQLAPPAYGALAQPPPGAAGLNNWLNVPAVPAPVAPVGNWLDAVPRSGSWADIIDTITPGNNLADIRHLRDSDRFDPPPVREPTAFTTLELKSCGYVRLPLDFDQQVITSGHTSNATALHADNILSKRMSELEPHMMKPLESTLGEIVNHIQGPEVAFLQNAWNLETSWNQNPATRRLCADARADGAMNPGRGRISGLLAAHPQTSSNGSHN